MFTNLFFCKKPLNVMFGGEIVKKNLPLKKFLHLENSWSKTESKAKLDLENFHQKILFAKSLKTSCLAEKLLKKISL